MKIRFLFFHGQDSWVGRGIRGWTWALALARLDFESLKYDFSHVEIHFPDEDGRFHHNQILMLNELDPISPPVAVPDEFICPDVFVGQCFSSTTRGTAKGVRFAPAAEVLKHPSRWSYIEVEVDDEKADDVKIAMNLWVDCEYDYWGIFGFFVPWNTQADLKWYCSEICAYFAYGLDITKKLHKSISPRRLAKVLIKATGGTLRELK